MKDKEFNLAFAYQSIVKFAKSGKANGLIFSELHTMAGCFPLYSSDIPPHDQPGCVPENCLNCNELMWISKKKRDLRLKGVVIYCLACLVASVLNSVNPKDAERFLNNIVRI
jgi:hypothetical protein